MAINQTTQQTDSIIKVNGVALATAKTNIDLNGVVHVDFTIQNAKAFSESTTEGLPDLITVLKDAIQEAVDGQVEPEATNAETE